MCVFLCPVSEIPIPDYEAESLESFLKKNYRLQDQSPDSSDIVSLDGTQKSIF